MDQLMILVEADTGIYRTILSTHTAQKQQWPMLQVSYRTVGLVNFSAL